MYPVDANLFSIMTALEGNPSDKVSILALRDWLQEHGGEGSPLLVPVVWVVEEAREGELNEGRGIYASKKLAMESVELLISTGPYPQLFRRVRDDGEHLDWEAGTHSVYMYAYKVKTRLE